MNLKLDAKLHKNRTVKITGIRILQMFLETLKTPLGPGADVAVGEAALYAPVVFLTKAP